jgi:hypothetical protein
VPDEGLPISYEILETDTPVYASDGTTVGKVARVRADLDADIFDGLEVDTSSGCRFVEAERVAAIHERGVDVSLTPDEVIALSGCESPAPAFKADPADHPGLLARIGERLGGRGGWKRSS